MSKRYYVYRLIDHDGEKTLLQGVLEVPEQSDGQTMGHDDARSMVADAAIGRMMRSNARPQLSHIEFCELAGREDERLSMHGEEVCFDWTRCQPEELELKLGEEQ